VQPLLLVLVLGGSETAQKTAAFQASRLGAVLQGQQSSLVLCAVCCRC
jgi:hypothetical protein